MKISHIPLKPLKKNKCAIRYHKESSRRAEKSRKMLMMMIKAAKLEWAGVGLEQGRSMAGVGPEQSKSRAEA